ncbi:MAG: glycoside hydrolase family 99-like domain-containing protein, partial [Clostridia bacterium]|nr:glycoside hydrolase family 99-like domain-containing protein [Clostridia bacterium]
MLKEKNIEKEKKMMVVAFYLPQFYSFPENDKWWGEDFTEWTNVKKSKPLWNGHYQPTIPLNNNFYRLDSIEPMKEQVRLARKYGVDGFCFYHYWFGKNRQLMEKPVENYLKEPSLDLPFCLCWANHNWSRTWVGGDKDVLMDMNYGDEEEWGKHFNYLIKFFKDDRYIKIDNKPVLVIYLPQDI